MSKEKSVDERFFHVFLDASANPEKVCPGDEMKFSATAFDFFGIEKVEAKIEHEKGYDIIEMSKTSGLNRYGTWEAKWVVHDTKVKEYSTIITAHSKSGFNYSKEVTWFDPVEDDWWDSDWNYRKEISISDSVSGYQMKLEVGYNDAASSYDVHCEGNCNNNFSDIRFTAADGTTSCSYWIEEKTDGDDCTIWVNSSGDSTMYIYYGNNEASNGSSGNDTFYFFDDFEGISMDSSIWQIDTSNYHVSSSILRINHSGVTLNDPLSFNMNDGYTLEGKIKYHESSGYSGSLQAQSSQYTQSSNGGADATNLYMRNGNNLYRWTGDGSGSGYNCGSGSLESLSMDTWYILSAKYNAAGVTLTRDRTNSYGTFGCGWAKNINYISLGYFAGSGACQDTSYDWVLIRKYVSSEPSWSSFGIEEIALPTEPTLNTPENNSYIKNTKPTFNWSSSENAQNYTLLIDNETDLTDGDEWINYSFDSTTTQNTTPDAKELTEGTWYWKVIANNSNGQNTSERWEFILDTTSPEQVNLSSPADDYNTTNNDVTFRWNTTSDNAGGSGIDHYQIQIASDSSFTQIITNDNSTTTNYTTKTIPEANTGVIYWRVRAWDRSENNGTWSDNRSLNVFNFDVKVENEDSAEITALKGETQSLTLSVTKEYSGSDCETVSLSYEWQSPQPSGINVNFDSSNVNASNDTSVEFEITDDATTGTFVCTLKGNWSGYYRNATVEVTSTGMIYSMDSFPQEFDMIRDDSASSIISIEFDMGRLEDVSLTGSWSSDAPSGVTVGLSTSSGTPPFDSTITFSTSKTAEEGDFIYKVQSSGSGVTKSEYFHLHIYTDITLTLEADEGTYEKGQKIQIKGTAKDPTGSNVGTGTATITLSSGNWSETTTTTISQGKYNTEYYITFDKPIGTYTISATATDSHGHATQNTPSTQVQVSEPENYEQYSINIISPTTGQLYKRGETITFTITLENQNQEKIQNANVQAIFNNGQTIRLTGGTGGTYTTSYDIPYNSQTGNISLYIEAKKEENDKLKVGFSHIQFKIQTIKPTIEILQPKPGQLIEQGEAIIIKIKATYPDGTPLQEAILTATGPNQESLTFKKTQENGIYTATYTPTNQDIGNWTMNIQIQDAYGNTATLNGGDIDIVQSKLTTNMIRYWYITTAIILITIFASAYLINKKLRQIKNNNLKNQIQQIKTLKQKNAVLYFSKGELTRETYDKLTQEYENKIAKLSKKQRLLEKKINRKNQKKEGET